MRNDAIFGASGTATSYATQAAAAAGFSGKNPGAALLQNLPPSMPPVDVFIGPKNAPVPPESAFPAEEKKATAAKPGDKKAHGTATASTGSQPKPQGNAAAARPNATLSNAEKMGLKPQPAPAPKPPRSRHRRAPTSRSPRHRATRRATGRMTAPPPRNPAADALSRDRS